jgi:NAD+ diphosphatase
MIPFTNNPLDRAAERRKDEAWLQARLNDPSTIVIAMRDGKPLVRDGALVRLTPDVARAAEHPLFLGLLGDVAWFAIEGEAELGTFEDFRSVALMLALMLPGEEASMAAAARSLFEWHRRHGFCSVCGQASTIAAAGWQRVCPACGAEHFPRVDPVVIMLPLFGGRCLLGRQFSWPKGRMSALAGFVEPGETIEEACAREVKEESGMIATRVTYFGSQPWPFPSSLMIGLFAEVESDAAVPDGTEIEEVRWLTREEARAVLDGTHPDVLAPSVLGISRHLLEAWASGA